MSGRRSISARHFALAADRFPARYRSRTPAALCRAQSVASDRQLRCSALGRLLPVAARYPRLLSRSRVSAVSGCAAATPPALRN